MDLQVVRVRARVRVRDGVRVRVGVKVGDGVRASVRVTGTGWCLEIPLVVQLQAEGDDKPPK